MDIYVDDVKATTWTSSGSTTGFEKVELGVSGQSIELRGVLEGSDWLSIAEVGAGRQSSVGEFSRTSGVLTWVTLPRQPHPTCLYTCIQHHHDSSLQLCGMRKHGSFRAVRPVRST